MFFIGISSIILGLVFGSFISALSWRYPRGMGIAAGRSICPKCKKQIAWYDNIPLFSFMALGGRCRNCAKKISPRYFIIELTTGIGFLFILKGYTLQGVYSLILFCLLEIIFVIDFEHKIIPDIFIFLGIFLVIIFLFLTDSPMIFPNLLAGLISAFLLLMIHLFTDGRGMGLGDVKFAVLGGIVMGLNLCLVWLFLAFLTGGIAGIILILFRRAGIKDQIAFGPFLVISIGLTILIGDKLLLLV